jgi:hypothetical protein
MTEENHPILGWEVFLYELQPTHLFCPVILVDGERIGYSGGKAFCIDCGRWISYGGTSTHYRDHVLLHENYNRRCRELSDPEGLANLVVSFLFQTGSAMLAIERFRRACPDREIPSHFQLPAILHILKSKVKAAIRHQCDTAAFVNIALDGWSDPAGRKYEGITIRTVQEDGSTAVYLAAMKAISARETADVVDAYLKSVVRRYNLKGKLVNVCTDRGSANKKAFLPSYTVPIKDFFRTLWIPCTCHILNNILGTFIAEINPLIDPVFKLASAFHGLPRFRNYLGEQGAPRANIPTYTDVRWHSAYDTIQALKILWPYMVAFVTETRVTVPWLTDQVIATIEALHPVFEACVKAQGYLESNDFATGSRFAGLLMGIRYRVQQFKRTFGFKRRITEGYIGLFTKNFHREWLVLVMQSILDPSVRLTHPEGDPISEATREEATNLLIDLVRQEICTAQAREEALVRQEEDEPSSGNFVDIPPSERRQWIPAEVQVATYLAMRNQGIYTVSFWNDVRPEMVELRTVARKILAVLTTSASAERGFSVGAHLCGDYQMAMSTATVSTRLIVQANWSVAAPLLPEVLAVGPHGWSACQKAYEAKKNRFLPVPPVVSDYEYVYDDDTDEDEAYDEGGKEEEEEADRQMESEKPPRCRIRIRRINHWKPPGREDSTDEFGLTRFPPPRPCPRRLKRQEAPPESADDYDGSPPVRIPVTTPPPIAGSSSDVDLPQPSRFLKRPPQKAPVVDESSDDFVTPPKSRFLKRPPQKAPVVDESSDDCDRPPKPRFFTRFRRKAPVVDESSDDCDRPPEPRFFTRFRRKAPVVDESSDDSDPPPPAQSRLPERPSFRGLRGARKRSARKDPPSSDPD